MTNEHHHPGSGRVDELLALLERQRALIDGLSTLVDQQATLVENREADALLGVLTRRQRIIDEFTATQDRMAVLAGAITTETGTISDEDRSQVQTLVDEIGRRLAYVMERDAADQRVLEEARQNVAQQLASLDTARQARQAYRGPVGGETRFADRKG